MITGLEWRHRVFSWTHTSHIGAEAIYPISSPYFVGIFMASCSLWLHLTKLQNWFSLWLASEQAPADYMNQWLTALLKYGHPVANCDPWIQRATQGSPLDGPFGDPWILYVLQKKFRKKSGQTTPQMYWYHIHGSAQDCSISIANTLEIPQFCTKPSVWLFVLVSE